MKDVTGDIVTYLHGQTLGGVLLAKGTNLFVGPMPEADGTLVGDNCVAVVDTGGAAPDRFAGGMGELRYPTCQVLVRGKAGRADPEAAKTFAGAVFDALTLPEVAGFLWIRPRESNPFPAPDDATGRPRWLFNLETAYQYTP